MHHALFVLNPWLSNPAGAIAGAAGQAAASAPTCAAADSAGGVKCYLPSGESDPAVTLDCPPAEPIDRAHRELLRQVDELIRANDRTCEKSLLELAAEDEPPMFLRATG